LRQIPYAYLVAIPSHLSAGLDCAGDVAVIKTIKLSWIGIWDIKNDINERGGKMREIKFRAWDKETTKMIYNAEMGFNMGSCFGDILDEVDKGKIILMQYTGLKDKNGKEIYEGDILIHAEWKVVVGWNKKRASFKLVARDGIVDAEDISMSQKYIEIIGNIYENPELMESK